MTIIYIVAMFFTAMVLGVFFLYMWYLSVISTQKYEVKKRLMRLASNKFDKKFPLNLRKEILRVMTPLDKLVFRVRPLRALDGMLERAGLRTDVKTFVAVELFLAISVLGAGLFFGAGMAGLAVAVLLVMSLPFVYLRFKAAKRVRDFTRQFPDALDMISRSIKGGHSFNSAIQVVGNELNEPVSGIFRTAYEEQLLGVSSRESIAHMTGKIESTDMRFFVMAINIHRDTGGNLGEILERLAKTIRERMTVLRQVKVYSAQARLSGYTLAVVPLAMGVFLYFYSPDYIGELFASDVGMKAIWVALAAQVVGFLIIRKIVDIRI